MIVNFRTEEHFTNAAVDLFRMNGWLVHHDRGEMRRHIQGDVGFPDIFAVRLPRAGAWPLTIVAAELKMPKGIVSDAQKVWLRTLEARGIRAYVWRPSDWDEIVAVATGRSFSAALPSSNS